MSGKLEPWLEFRCWTAGWDWFARPGSKNFAVPELQLQARFAGPGACGAAHCQGAVAVTTRGGPARRNPAPVLRLVPAIPCAFFLFLW